MCPTPRRAALVNLIALMSDDSERINGAAASMGPRRTGQWIVIVEPRAALRVEMRALLESEGYVVTDFADCGEALECLRGRPDPPTLVLVDLHSRGGQRLLDSVGPGPHLRIVYAGAGQPDDIQSAAHKRR
jgi:hypothetical protein